MSDNILKGTAYELYINNYLNNIDNQQSWMWKKVPEKVLRECNILGDWNIHRLNRINNKMIFSNNNNNDDNYENQLMDLGADIILRKDNINDNTYQYFIVQCKNYSSNNQVSIKKLAGFYFMITQCEISGILYYTSKLNNNIIHQRNSKLVTYINKPFDNENLDNTIELSTSTYTDLLNKPYDYQIEAYDILYKCFLHNNRAILNLPCGLGKTLISIMLGLNYDQIVIISPLKEYCLQNLERFMSEIKYKDYKGLLIDTDGTRDINKISEFILNNNKIVLSVCYKSCDVLLQIINLFKSNHLIIIDEFHNISKNDINGLIPNGIGGVLQTKLNILFMSATPRIFNIGDDEDDEEDEMFDTTNELFGKIEYKYEFRDAIKTNKICDYEVYIPDIQLDNNKFIDDIRNEVDLTDLTNDNLIKSNFLLRSMLETGSQRCIIYAKTQIDAYSIKECIMRLNKYFMLDLYVDTLLSVDGKNDRKTKLNDFKTFDGITILISVEILNECIDIISCDSIYFSHKCESRIKIIQRICRAIRKDPNNPHKIARVFVWCQEYSEMTDIITNLKDFDYDFNLNKINIFQINNHDFQIIPRNKDTDNKYSLLNAYLLGVKQIFSWKHKYDLMIEYINTNNRAPSRYNNDLNIKYLGQFFSNQVFAYKNKIKMMRHKMFYDIWTNFMNNYPHCFLSIENKWINTLDLVKNFIITNNKSPSRYSKESDNDTILNQDDDDIIDNNEVKLGMWLNSQRSHFNNKTKIFSVKTVNGNIEYNHPNIVQIWNNFNNDFKEYSMSNDEKWITQFNALKDYINKYGKRPSCKTKDDNIRQLGVFIQTQNKNFNNRTQIMSNEKYYEEWKKFKEEYKEYFTSVIDKWFDKLNEVKTFIDIHHHRPNKHSTNPNERSLGDWLVKQTAKYNKTNMNNEEVNDAFIDFIEEYSNYL